MLPSFRGVYLFMSNERRTSRGIDDKFPICQVDDDEEAWEGGGRKKVEDKKLNWLKMVHLYLR